MVTKRNRNYRSSTTVSKARRRADFRRTMARARLAPAPRGRLLPRVDAGYYDLAHASYACDTTGTVTLIATIGQGASVQQRIGKRAAWKSLQIRGQITASANVASTTACYLVVYDKRPTGALPAVTDILVSASSNAFNNDDNSGRFQIVRRKTYSLVGNGTAANGSSPTAKTHYAIDEFINLKMRPVTFGSAGTGAIGDIESGALYLITVGTGGTSSVDADLSVGMRTRFLDQ